MNSLRLTKTALATALLAFGATASAHRAAPAGGETTILSTLTELDRFTNTEDENGLDRFRWSQSNWYDYDILTAAVVLDGTLVGAVIDEATSVTLFAPNDRAFQLLAYDLTGDWFFTEAQVLGAIVEAVEAGAVDLTNVLEYHIVGGRIEKAAVPFNTPVPTLSGDTITFRPRFFGFFVELQDNVAAFRNPFLVRTDIDAGNSIIHSISRVLIPVNVGG